MLPLFRAVYVQFSSHTRFFAAFAAFFADSQQAFFERERARARADAAFPAFYRYATTT